MILLVLGFDDSVPPTGDKIFKIEYSENVQSIKTISDDALDFWVFDIELKQNSAGILDIKIPKNFPTPASFTGSWNYGNEPIVLADKAEIRYQLVEDPCYFYYKIPVEGKTNVEIAYPVILAGTWQLYSPIQFDENNPCYDKVFYEQPILSPLKQFKSGISVNNIICRGNLELIIKESGFDSPACVTPITKSKLIERGWATELE